MHRITALLALALGCAAAASCLQTSTALNPNYCGGGQDGDAFCTDKYPDGSLPYCTQGIAECTEELTGDDIDGCVSIRPADECYSPCGQGNAFVDDASCLDDETTVAEASTTEGSSSSGEPTSTSIGPETDTEEPTSTTGPECSEDMPCMDPAAPFCVEGSCSTCDSTQAPDDACAELDADLPLCVGTACVQCTAEDASACGGTTPLCDAEANTCVGCSFHEECQDLELPACNIATGACFSNDAVTMVNLSGANALQMAVNGVADGAERAIVVTGSAASTHSAVIDAGKSIAIVSMNDSLQTIRGAGGSPTLVVSGAGSTVYLHRVRLEDSNDVGISVESSGTLYADNVQVAGNDGGGITLAAGTSGFIRNCMVAGVGGEAPAMSSSGTLSVVFSSFGLNTNFGDPVLECSGGTTTVRNSIIVSQTNAPGTEVDCPGISIENSAQRASQTPADWFGTGFASGNYSLNAAGQTEFADIAIWELGDPPFDFEGDDRPNTDGAMDFAGADTIP